MNCQKKITNRINENNIEPEESMAQLNIPTLNRFKLLSKLYEEPNYANHLETGLTPRSATLATSLVPASTFSRLRLHFLQDDL